MKFSLRARLIVLGVPLLLCLLLLEVAVRLLSPADQDGNRRFRDTRLKPYHPPVRKTEGILAQYLASKDSGLIYDPDLGWSQRPHAARHNSAGFISSEPAVPMEPSPGRLRIAVFGGSYTQGSTDQAWWRVLEDELNSHGLPAEVLNFGVGGYGMDQAYLRWKRDGAPYRPQIVIFGFCAGNSYDNLNLIRMIKDPDTSIPFTKPRFVLEGEDLRLLNSPTPAPSAMVAITAHPEAWPLSARDFFWVPRDFQMTWWRHSLLAALAEAKFSAKSRAHSPENFYQMTGEPAQLALRITAKFQAEVQAAGSAFLVAHLPYITELEAWKAKGRFPHEELYAAVKSRAPVIAPEQAMLAACGERPPRSFFSDGHYTDEFQAVVGKEIAAFLRTHPEAWKIPPTR